MNSIRQAHGRQGKQDRFAQDKRDSWFVIYYFSVFMALMSFLLRTSARWLFTTKIACTTPGIQKSRQRNIFRTNWMGLPHSNTAKGGSIKAKRYLISYALSKEFYLSKNLCSWVQMYPKQYVTSSGLFGRKPPHCPFGAEISGW
jgi:hypothetical protein